MPIPLWRSKYLLNIYSIDSQHLNIAFNTSKLYEMVKARAEFKECEVEFENLLSVVENHFAFEESKMAAIEFEKTETHIREHDELLKILRDCANSIECGNYLVTARILTFLMKRFFEHILTSDALFSEELREVYEL